MLKENLKNYVGIVICGFAALVLTIHGEWICNRITEYFRL